MYFQTHSVEVAHNGPPVGEGWLCQHAHRQTRLYSQSAPHTAIPVHLVITATHLSCQVVYAVCQTRVIGQRNDDIIINNLTLVADAVVNGHFVYAVYLFTKFNIGR